MAMLHPRRFFAGTSYAESYNQHRGGAGTSRSRAAMAHAVCWNRHCGELQPALRRAATSKTAITSVASDGRHFLGVIVFATTSPNFCYHVFDLCYHRLRFLLPPYFFYFFAGCIWNHFNFFVTTVFDLCYHRLCFLLPLYLIFCWIHLFLLGTTPNLLPPSFFLLPLYLIFATIPSFDFFARTSEFILL